MGHDGGSTQPVVPDGAIAEAGLLDVLDRLPTIVWTMDRELRFTSASGGALPSARDGGRVSPIGLLLQDYVGSSDADHAAVRAHRGALAGEVSAFDWHGAGFVYRAQVAPRRSSDGEIVGAIGVAFDLSFQEALYGGVFDNALVPLAVLDSEWNIVEANAALAELVGEGRGELSGRSLRSLAPEAALGELNALLGDAAGDGRLTGEVTLRRADGSAGRVLLSAVTGVAPGRNLTVLLDVTERRELEAALRRTQKMDAVGRLAAGIAHDFNNVLLVISGHAELLRAEAPDGQVADSVAEILGAVELATKLTRSLLTFGGPEEAGRAVTDVREVVRGILALTRSTFAPGIETTIEFDPATPVVLIDRTRLEQVVLNLVVNARDAMPAGGTLAVTAVPHVERGRSADLAPGRYARVAVVDTGIGMDELTLQHAFEPFFSTKVDGTGFGLPTVYGIVHGSGGAVRLRSAAGSGTTVEVFLPAAAQ